VVFRAVKQAVGIDAVSAAIARCCAVERLGVPTREQVLAAIHTLELPGSTALYDRMGEGDHVTLLLEAVKQVLDEERAAHPYRHPVDRRVTEAEPAAKVEFRCDYGCSYCGSYAAVKQHELSCPLASRVARAAHAVELAQAKATADAAGAALELRVMELLAVAGEHEARAVAAEREAASLREQLEAAKAAAVASPARHTHHWSDQAVFGDSRLACSDESLRRANISSDKVEMRNLAQDSDELATAMKTVHPILLRFLRSSFVETRPHALEFIDDPALLSVALAKPYENADDLVVLHKSKPSAAWEVLNEEVELSEGGKRASIRVRSFCTRVIVDAAAIPDQQAPLVATRPLPRHRTGFFAGEHSSDSGGDDDDVDRGELDSVPTTSDAFFSAFAPHEIMPDGKSFLVEVTMFALEHSVEVTDDAEARGKMKAGARKQLPIAHGEAVSIVLDLPEAFDTDQDVAQV
jgi:hypothetical protein